jgi:hypothetical protein
VILGQPLRNQMKKLKICGYDFKLVYKNTVLVDSDKCLGCCMSDKSIIELKKGMDKEKKKEVILHEAIHAMSDIMDLGLGEKAVNTLGVVMVNFMKNNKKFIRSIIGEVNG